MYTTFFAYNRLVARNDPVFHAGYRRTDPAGGFAQRPRVTFSPKMVLAFKNPTGYKEPNKKEARSVFTRTFQNILALHHERKNRTAELHYPELAS